jgi:hypothetical protein
MRPADRFVRHRLPLAIILLGLALRGMAILLFPVDPISDYAWYLDRGRELAAGLGYVDAGIPTAFWPVGYPAILAAIIAVTGSDVGAPLIANLLFAAATGWGMVALGDRLGMPRPATVVALLLWAIYPNAIFYAPQFASEGPYAPLLLWGLVLLIDRRWTFAILSGLLFGIATLIKAQSYVLPLPALLLLWAMRPDSGWRGIAARALLLHVAMFAVIAPWTIRNYRLFGEPVMVSTNGGATLLNGNNDLATGGYINDAEVPAIERVYARTGVPKDQRTLRQLDYDHRAKALGWQWIREHPGAFAALVPRKLAGLWLIDGEAAWAYEMQFPEAARAIRIVRIADELLYLAILALALCGFVAACHGLVVRRTMPGEAMLFLFPGFITAIAIVFSGQSRFHAPAMPFLMMAAAWWGWARWQAWRAGRQGTSATG